MDLKRARRGIVAARKMSEPDSDEHFAYIAGYTEGGFPYGITWKEMREKETDIMPTQARCMPALKNLLSGE
jgi:hypothetical protein